MYLAGGRSLKGRNANRNASGGDIGTLCRWDYAFISRFGPCSCCHACPKGREWLDRRNPRRSGIGLIVAPALGCIGDGSDLNLLARFSASFSPRPVFRVRTGRKNRAAASSGRSFRADEHRSFAGVRSPWPASSQHRAPLARAKPARSAGPWPYRRISLALPSPSLSLFRARFRLGVYRYAEKHIRNTKLMGHLSVPSTVRGAEEPPR